ncbi:MAG: hypothetical protein EOP19_05300, partial [Hyphomicrobiales bacterium]
MEWIIVLAILALPVIRLLLLPARVASTVRRLPIGQMAIIGAVLIAGWFVLDAVTSPRESTGAYMRGDAAVRKLLSE